MVMILVFVIILLLFLFLFSSSSIPRKIWTYWDSDELPPLITKCIDTWRDKNPNYEINVITDNTLHKYISREEIYKIKTWRHNDCHQKFSDLVRLNILSKYGGIWLDASIVCFESFDWVHEENAECILYSIRELAPYDKPLLESWFIACTPGNKFVTKWRDEFMSVENFSTAQAYVDYAKPDLTGIKYIDYLLVYACAKKVYAEDPSLVKVLNASTGPYKYHLQGGVKNICNVERPKFYKFRKEDRAALEDEQLECLFSPFHI